MINLESASVENIHRIQKKPSHKTNEELLDLQQHFHEEGVDNMPIDSGKEYQYEPSQRVQQELGPVEKKPHGGWADMSRDYMFEKNEEYKLRTKRKHDKPRFVKRKEVKTSQRTLDYVNVLKRSFVNVFALLDNAESNGSGFFISKNHIITAAHVLLLTPDQNNNVDILHRIQVGVRIEGQMYKAFVQVYDVLGDFAILFLDTVNLGLYNNVQPINLGNSTDIRSGEEVLLFGNPLSNSITEPTVTHGIVSVSSDVAEDGMFVVDAEALEGMSGGMVYSKDRNAVIGVISSYFSNNINPGGATTLTLCVGVDKIKNMAKRYKIPFSYKETSLDEKISSNYGSTIKDDDERRYNESVGVTGGPGMQIKNRPYGEKSLESNRNKKKYKKYTRNLGGTVHTVSPHYNYHTEHGMPGYQDSSSSTSSYDSKPFSNVPEDLKDNRFIKDKKKHLQNQKGDWLFDMPLRYQSSDSSNISIYRDGDNYRAYKDGEEIASSYKSNGNQKPLISLLNQIMNKYHFDSTYTEYIEDYGKGVMQ